VHVACSDGRWEKKTRGHAEYLRGSAAKPFNILILFFSYPQNQEKGMPLRPRGVTGSGYFQIDLVYIVIKAL
jgi:hypothetical protein